MNRELTPKENKSLQKQVDKTWANREANKKYWEQVEKVSNLKNN